MERAFYCNISETLTFAGSFSFAGNTFVTRLHPQGRVARRAYVLDRKYRFCIRELSDLGFQNQKFPKNETFLEHFLITKYRFSIRELSDLGFQNWFMGHVQNSYLRRYSDKNR